MYKAFSQYPVGLAEPVTGPDRIAAMVRDIVPETEAREWCICFYLNARNAVLRTEVVSIGNLNSTLIDPRGVFTPALECHANGIVVAHNHPSGDPTPSEQDNQVTARLGQVGAIMGIPLLDHVVVGAGGSFVSLRALANEVVQP